MTNPDAAGAGRPVFVLAIGHDLTDDDAERIQAVVVEALRDRTKPESATCARCGARLARASWRLPWTATDAYDPCWCVIDGVWQAHQPSPKETPA